MKTNRTQRLQLAHAIREQLPWAHIVVGARGYNFIEVSRGESIKGSYSTGNKVGYGGSAWSRAWPGSYCLHVDLSGGWVECRRHMEPMHWETERMIVCNRWTLPTGNSGQRAADRLRMLADWIVSKAATHLPEAPKDAGLLRPYERFDVRVNELEPALKVVRR